MPLEATQNYQNQLKIIPLGGVEEIGYNCTVFEYNNQIVVVDVGLGFPDHDMYGVDYLVPNTAYLERVKEQIQGIIITHGHLDHIGGLPYLLPRLGFPPIYGSPFTIELIRAKLQDSELADKVQLNKVDTTSVLTSGDFKIEFFAVNHSIPQSMGLYIQTPTSKVVHTGDFKFDNSPINEPVADYAKMARIGEQGIDLLLSDSTNSLKKGYPISESAVSDKLDKIIKNAEGRIIIGAFSGLVGRLYQIIKLAEKHGRKVAIAGYGMNQTLRIAEEIGYIKPKAGIIVPIQRINRYHPDKVIILTTGSQGEENAALFRMATEGYKNVYINKGDSVILSAGTIPGNQSAVQVLTDAISEKGGNVIQSEDMDFFTSGHGYQEDQKIMLNLIKPKYFMPVHGYQYFLKEHGRTAMQVGIKEKNIIISKRGSVIVGDNVMGFKQTALIKCLPLLVSGFGVGDIGQAVLNERKQLGNYGVVSILLNIDPASKGLITEPLMYSKGFVYVRNSMDLFDMLKENIKAQMAKPQIKNLETSKLKEKMALIASELLMNETGRDPAVLIMLNHIRTEASVKAKPKQTRNIEPGNELPGYEVSTESSVANLNKPKVQRQRKPFAPRAKKPLVESNLPISPLE